MLRRETASVVIFQCSKIYFVPLVVLMGIEKGDFYECFEIRTYVTSSLASQSAFSSFILQREEKGSGVLTSKNLHNVLPSLW